MNVADALKIASVNVAADKYFENNLTDLTVCVKLVIVEGGLRRWGKN